MTCKGSAHSNKLFLSVQVNKFWQTMSEDVKPYLRRFWQWCPGQPLTLSHSHAHSVESPGISSQRFLQITNQIEMFIKSRSETAI